MLVSDTAGVYRFRNTEGLGTPACPITHVKSAMTCVLRLLQDAAAQPPAAPTGDVLRYWKYCHLIPAKGLRVAYDNLLDGRCGSQCILMFWSVLLSRDPCLLA